ncbi:MAG TPA: hypothetical protein VM598_04290 [Bdellovibrionota bacterium]|nr:hypothetical protein [Bdellovibrionota bacterium]
MKFPTQSPTLAVAILALASLTTGCGKNQNVELAFSSYTVAGAGPALQRPQTMLASFDRWLDALFPKAQASVSQIKMCFKRLRFKEQDESTSSDSSQDEDNHDLDLGLVTLDTSGTTLASVEIPKGVYKRIEFDLEDDCGVGYSLYVDNNGAIQTNDRMTIKFEGTFDATAAGGRIQLAVQNIVTALGAVTSGTDLKDAAEDSSGTF